MCVLWLENANKGGAFNWLGECRPRRDLVDRRLSNSNIYRGYGNGKVQPIRRMPCEAIICTWKCKDAWQKPEAEAKATAELDACVSSPAFWPSAPGKCNWKFHKLIAAVNAKAVTSHMHGEKSLQEINFKFIRTVLSKDLRATVPKNVLMLRTVF